MWRVFRGGHYRAKLPAESFSDINGNASGSDFVFELTVLGGDADSNGRINIDDYFAIDFGHANSLPGYRHGDFNHSGGPPDGDDYFVIDTAFTSQLPLGGAPLAGAAVSFGIVPIGGEGGDWERVFDGGEDAIL